MALNMSVTWPSFRSGLNVLIFTTLPDLLRDVKLSINYAQVRAGSAMVRTERLHYKYWNVMMIFKSLQIVG